MRSLIKVIEIPAYRPPLAVWYVLIGLIVISLLPRLQPGFATAPSIPLFAMLVSSFCLIVATLILLPCTMAIPVLERSESGQESRRNS